MILVYLKTETYHFKNDELEDYVTICYNSNLRSLPEQISVRASSFSEMQWYLDSLVATKFYPEMSFGFMPYELWEENIVGNAQAKSKNILIPIPNFKEMSIDVETYIWRNNSKNE